MRRTLVTVTGCAALALASAAPALAAPLHRKLVMKEAGTRLSTSGGDRYEDVYRIKSSPFGGGTTIRDATLAGSTFPASGKDTATMLFKDGRLVANETVTLGAPNVNGVGPITGTGTCTGGTFKHQRETCTYKLRGSYDLTTGKTFITIVGTYTPGKQSTPKKK